MTVALFPLFDPTTGDPIGSYPVVELANEAERLTAALIEARLLAKHPTPATFKVLNRAISDDYREFCVAPRRADGSPNLGRECAVMALWSGRFAIVD